MSQNKLRILLLSDVIDRRYDQKWDEHCFDGIDLIISLWRSSRKLFGIYRHNVSWRCVIRCW